MATQTSRTVRPTQTSFFLGWMIVLLAVISIAGTLAQLARLPAVLVPRGGETVEIVRPRQL